MSINLQAEQRYPLCKLGQVGRQPSKLRSQLSGFFRSHQSSAPLLVSWTCCASHETRCGRNNAMQKNALAMQDACMAKV